MNIIPILNNALIASNGRVISNAQPYDEINNRGIRTHNIIGKIIADLFAGYWGSGTLTMHIQGEDLYLNRRSCFNLLKDHRIDYDPENEKDLIGKIQQVFDNSHKKVLFNKLKSNREFNTNMHELHEKIYSEIKDMPESMKETLRTINQRLAKNNEDCIFDEAQKIGIDLKQFEVESKKNGQKDFLLNQLKGNRKKNEKKLIDAKKFCSKLTISESIEYMKKIQEECQRLESNVFEHAKRLDIDLGVEQQNFFG